MMLAQVFIEKWPSAISLMGAISDALFESMSASKSATSARLLSRMAISDALFE
jgi:hypothetical protein